MQPLRVAYVAPSLDETTGWGRWCVDFLRYVRSIDIEPLVYAPVSQASAADLARVGSNARFVLPEHFDHLPSVRGIRSVPRVITFMRSDACDGKVDLVHSMEAFPWGFYGHCLARRIGVPHVMTTHGRYGYIAADRILDRTLFLRVMRRCHTMMAVSEAVCTAVRSRFGELPATMRLMSIQNAIAGLPQGQATAAVGRNDGSPPLVLSVTRFVPVKDIATAVNAFDLVRSEIPDCQYIIAGPGNGPGNRYYQELSDLIIRRNIAGIRIVGRVPRSELSAYYGRASVLLQTAQTLPDDFEAAGMVSLEAGLFGVPVVASASGGIPEVVSHERTGLLVPEKNAPEAAAAMLRILRDTDLAHRLGSGNRKRARERNWTWYMSEVSGVYSQALASMPSATR